MMKREVVLTGGIVLLGIFQLGFLGSLPGMWSGLPLFFSLCLYLLTRHRFAPSGVWLVGFGCVLGFFSLGEAPLDPISYLVTACVAYWMSRRVFSTQSFYAVVSSAGVGFILLSFLQNLFVFFVVWLGRSQSVEWMAVFTRQGVRALMVVALVAFLYVLVPMALRAFSIRQRQRLAPPHL